MSESTLKKNICEKAQKIPGLYLVRRMASGNNAGEPDIFGIFNGRHVEIEAKIGKNTPTPLQEHDLQKWYELNAITGCVWSMTDVYHLLLPYTKTEEQASLLHSLFNKKEKLKLISSFDPF
jgi:hypothetical protein